MTAQELDVRKWATENRPPARDSEKFVNKRKDLTELWRKKPNTGGSPGNKCNEM